MITAAAILWSLITMSAISQPPPQSVAGVQGPLDTLVRAGGHDLHFVLYRGALPVTILMEAGGAGDRRHGRGVRPCGTRR